MLSSVLKSKRAINVNIEIMRAFVKLRETAWPLSLSVVNQRPEPVHLRSELHTHGACEMRGKASEWCLLAKRKLPLNFKSRNHGRVPEWIEFQSECRCEDSSGLCDLIDVQSCRVLRIIFGKNSLPASCDPHFDERPVAGPSIEVVARPHAHGPKFHPQAIGPLNAVQIPYGIGP